MQAWFDEAYKDRSTPNPLAMTLSTVGKDGSVFEDGIAKGV